MVSYISTNDLYVTSEIGNFNRVFAQTDNISLLFGYPSRVYVENNSTLTTKNKGGKAMMDFSTRYVEVCDLPYCSEPDLFYCQRMKVGLRVKELREGACRLFGKQNNQLTLRDLKLAFLKMHPIKVNLGGNDHEVTVKKLNRRWLLECNCRAWIFNLSGDRRCKHTTHIEELMRKEEERWGVR